MDDIIYDYSFDELEGHEEANRQVVRGMPWEYASAPNMIYGAPSSAKSAFTIAFGIHLAAGAPFLNFDQVPRHNVYYVDYDGNNIASIVSKFKRGFGLDLDGKYFRITNAAVDQPRVTKVNDEEFRQHFGNRIDAQRQSTGIPESIIVFDTLNGLAPNVSENDAAIGQHLQNLTLLAKMDPDQKLAVVFLHHKSKGGSTERGSSSIRAGCASCINIDCAVRGGRKIYSMEVDKDRIDPDGGWPALQFTFNDLAYRIDNRKPYASRIELAPTNEKSEGAGQESNKVEQIRQFMISRIQGSRISDIVDALHLRKQFAVDTVNQFESDGLAKMAREGRRELWHYCGKNGHDHEDRIDALIDGVRRSKNQAEGA